MGWARTPRRRTTRRSVGCCCSSRRRGRFHPSPRNYISARKSRSGRTGDGGNYIKPLLVQAAWAAIPGSRSAAGQVPPPGPQVRRPEEQGRAETGDHRDRAHPTPSSRPARPTANPAPASAPAATPPRPARNTCCGSSRNSSPAAASPSPPRRPPDSANPLIPDRLPGAARRLPRPAQPSRRHKPPPAAAARTTHLITLSAKARAGRGYW